MTNQDLGQASNFSNQYNQDVNASNAAQQGVQSQIQYMQGAGSGQNLYNQQLQSLQNQYDPNLGKQITSGTNALNLANGALNGLSNQFNSAGGGIGGFGMTGTGVANYEQAALQPLQAGAQTANNSLTQYNNLLGNLTTGANQATTAGVQTEQGALTGLQSQYTNALAQQQQAQSQMQFYSQLASTQQGLTASQAAAYAQAQSAFQNAGAAIEQAQAAMKTATANAALTNQNVAANAAYMKKYGTTGGVFGQTVQSTPKTSTPVKPTTPAKSTSSKPSTINTILGGGPKAQSALGNQAKQYGSNIVNRLKSNASIFEL